MQVIQANGIHLNIEDSGSRSAPTLVFSNSLGTDFRIWDRMISELGGDYRIVRYDKRGHGLSDAPDAPYAMADHVGDLAEILTQLDVRDAIVVGLSVGGLIAQGLAAAHPGMVRALMLCDTAHNIGPPEMWDARIAALREKGVGGIAEAVLERWFSQAFRDGQAEEVALWRNMLVRTPIEGYVGTCAALRDADFTESTSRLKVPVLCVCGSEDGATVPDLVRSLAELIEGARFELVDGAGHLPCIERPKEMATLLESFLKEAGVV